MHFIAQHFTNIDTSSDDPVDVVEDVIDDRDVDDGVDGAVEDVAEDGVEGVEDVVKGGGGGGGAPATSLLSKVLLLDNEEHLFNVFRPSLFIFTSTTDFKCMPKKLTHMPAQLEKAADFFLCC